LRLNEQLSFEFVSKYASAISVKIWILQNVQVDLVRIVWFERYSVSVQFF